MSLLTPVKVPVKVYKWDDVGAPQLDKSPNCVATIFKACLVTGYGAKEPAGWTMPFEDTSAGVKVLRPEIGPHTDFYLRLSTDTGTEMAVQMYLNMTDVNTGDLKLQCATPFKYAKTTTANKWLLVATPRAYWFFCNSTFGAQTGVKNGAYVFCGDVVSANTASVYLQHTGGTAVNGNMQSMFQSSKTDYGYAGGKLYDSTTGQVFTINPESAADSIKNITTDDYTNSVYVIADKKMHILPGISVPFSGAKYDNFTSVLKSSDGEHNYIVFGVAVAEPSNVYIATDDWVF